MKQAYTVALFLLGIVPALLQDQQPSSVGRIETKYDRVADMTTVQCDLVELGKGAPRLIVQANASFRGKEPNETAIFWLGLSAYKGGATRHTQPSFKDAATLCLLVDSARLEVPVKDYGSDFFELNRLLAERARAEISREDLRKLLDAKSLAGQWGAAEFKLSDGALVSLKGFISRWVFAANDRLNSPTPASLPPQQQRSAMRPSSRGVQQHSISIMMRRRRFFLSTTEAQHGNILAGRALCAAFDDEEIRFYGNRRDDTRIRDRREHGDLQSDLRHSAAPVPLL